MSKTLRTQFGQRVRELRLAAGLSQEAFADRCGIARSYMSRVERGVGNPSLDAIEVLAVALGVPVVELFDVASPKPVKSQRVSSKPTQVPFASDGSCFNPELRRRGTGMYSVGEKGAVVRFKEFDDALAHLAKMKPGKWWRPNPAKPSEWGLVSAVTWGNLPEQFSAKSTRR